MRDTNGTIGPDGDIGYEHPITLKVLAAFGAVSVALYAAFSYFGSVAIIAVGAATVGAVFGMFVLKR